MTTTTCCFIYIVDSIVVVVGSMCETTALKQFSSLNKQISLSKYVKFFPATSQICQSLFAALLSSVCRCRYTVLRRWHCQRIAAVSSLQPEARVSDHLTFRQISCALIFDARFRLLNWIFGLVDAHGKLRGSWPAGSVSICWALGRKMPTSMMTYSEKM